MGDRTGKRRVYVIGAAIWMVGLPVPCIPPVLLYPITRERFDEIRRGLEERALDKETVGGQSG